MNPFNFTIFRAFIPTYITLQLDPVLDWAHTKCVCKYAIHVVYTNYFEERASTRCHRSLASFTEVTSVSAPNVN